jgi:DNA-binding transcriptional LysR family regulator
MTQRDPDWALLRTFLEVVRDGSQSAAARRLGLTQPSVARQLEALETALELALFTRSPRGLVPTEAARALVPHVEAMAAAFAALRREASGTAQSEQGSVRIAASEVMGCEILPPILADFRRRHPGIAFELVLSNRQEDLLRQDADIAVRMVQPIQKALLATRLGRTHIGLFAHKDYIAAFGMPATLAELARHHLIGFDRDDHSFRSVGPPAASLTRDSFSFRCDSDIGQLAALRAGLGIAGCQTAVAAATPSLLPVLPKAVRLSLDVWLAMHEDLKTTRRIRLVFDHISQALSAFLANHRRPTGV